MCADLNAKRLSSCHVSLLAIISQLASTFPSLFYVFLCVKFFVPFFPSSKPLLIVYPHPTPFSPQKNHYFILKLPFYLYVTVWSSSVGPWILFKQVTSCHAQLCSIISFSDGIAKSLVQLQFFLGSSSGSVSIARCRLTWNRSPPLWFLAQSTSHISHPHASVILL